MLPMNGDVQALYLHGGTAPSTAEARPHRIQDGQTPPCLAANTSETQGGFPLPFDVLIAHTSTSHPALGKHNQLMGTSTTTKKQVLSSQWQSIQCQPVYSNASVAAFRVTLNRARKAMLENSTTVNSHPKKKPLSDCIVHPLRVITVNAHSEGSTSESTSLFSSGYKTSMWSHMYTSPNRKLSNNPSACTCRHAILLELLDT